EQRVAEAAAAVMDVSFDMIHDDVERALGRVVDEMRLERCALFVLRPGQSRASISHVAYARGSRGAELGFGAEILPRLASALHEGTAIELDEAVGTLRPGFASDPAEGAVVLVPVSSADGAVSGILFRATHRTRALPADMVSRMLLVGQILLSAVRRRGAEVSLRTSEERYRTVVESQSDLICRYLPDTTLTFVNDAYCRY